MAVSSFKTIGLPVEGADCAPGAVRLELTRVLSVSSLTEAEVLALAAAIERGNGHPAARAIVRAAGPPDLLLAPEDLTAYPGRGDAARLCGRWWTLGSRRLLEERGIPVFPEEAAQAAALEAGGATVVYLAGGECVAGLLALVSADVSEARPVGYGLRAKPPGP